MEIWRYGDMEIGRHGDMEISRYGVRELWRDGYMCGARCMMPGAVQYARPQNGSADIYIYIFIYLHIYIYIYVMAGMKDPQQ